MIDKLKNYLLWPLFGITLALFIYLIFVFTTYKFISNCSLETENKMWNLIIEDLPYQQVALAQQKDIQNIVDKLPKKFIPKQYDKIKIVVLISADVNAFAAPGGKIIITSGLLEQNLSQEALLFVIGHEIAHLYRRDHLYELAKMLTAYFYGSFSGSEIITELLLSLDNSKLKETEFIADKFSVEMLESYLHNNNGANEFFQYLINNNRYTQSSTHPSAKERLDKLNSNISN